MAVSVRMDSLLERELESAAQRAGLTKSQFIIDAVERALGRKDAYSALLKAHRDFGISSAPAPQVQPPQPGLSGEYSREALQRRLAARHDAEMRDWLAYQAARERGQTWQPDDEAPRAEE